MLPFTRQNKPSSPGFHTITVRISDRAKKRFDEMMTITKAPDAGTLVRNALRLYDAMIQECKAGNKMAAIQPNGDVVPYQILMTEDESQSA